MHRNETSKFNGFWTQKAYASDFAFMGKMDAKTLERLNAWSFERKKKKDAKMDAFTLERFYALRLNAWTQKAKKI